jgi:hypothetical protein
MNESTKTPVTQAPLTRHVREGERDESEVRWSERSDREQRKHTLTLTHSPREEREQSRENTTLILTHSLTHSHLHKDREKN